MTQKVSLTSRKPATRRQMKQVGTLTEEAVGSGFNRNQLQYVHANGRDYKREYRKFLRGFVPREGSGLWVPTDYSRLVRLAIQAGYYDSVYVNPAFTDANLPVTSLTGEVDTEVNFRQRPKVTTTAQWLAALDDNKDSTEKFAHPLSVLAIGEEQPDEQRKGPIFTLWRDSTGQLWYLILGVVVRNRNVDLDRDRPGDGWDGRGRAAVVRK
ncbi:MAG: hypothetical protein Q8P83_01605 [bacterium]|nr:hypothetical protein [bacterium]